MKVYNIHVLKPQGQRQTIVKILYIASRITNFAK